MVSCKRPSRCPTPFIEAIAQTRRAPRNRANLVSNCAPLVRCCGYRPYPHGCSGRQQLFNPLSCGNLINPLDSGKFSHKPIKGGLVNLSLAIGLLWLTDVAIEIPNYLSYRTGITGSDLSLIFLS